MFISGFKVGSRGGKGVEVSHLLFVDDALIFCETSKDQLLHLHWVLMWFEAISGLKINLEKSERILVGRVPIMEELVDILGCEVGLLPSKYLGLPLGATFKSTTMSSPLIHISSLMAEAGRVHHILFSYY